jgi:orotate phosphoribosyltransferase
VGGRDVRELRCGARTAVAVYARREVATVERYKTELIEFMVRSDVLRFGDFTAKSGRKTPYFFDAGRFGTGAQLSTLGRFYARAIQEQLALEHDVLFGPAYKGIPLVVATSLALYQHYGRDVPFCFNRKEAKDHGEGGVLVGHRLRDGDRVLVIEDVTTAGTSLRETMPILQRAARVQPVGLLVAVDRMERGTGERSALRELAESYGIRTCALVTVEEIMTHLHGRELDGRVVLDDALYARMQEYRAQYGA